MVLVNFPAIKTSLIVLSLICAFCGFWMALAGLAMQYKLSDMLYLSGGDNLLAICTKLMIVLGWAVVATGFYGIFGVMRHSYCLMILYVLLLTTLIFLQVTVALILFGLIDTIPSKDVKRFEMLFDTVVKNRLPTDRIERFQNTYGCCGKRSYKDWEAFDEGLAPKCRSYAQGCLQVLEACIRHIVRVLGWGLLVLATVQFMTLLLAGCLTKGIGARSN